MTILQMRYFLMICKYGNITEAAKKMYLSQPSLSISMKELEKELGVSLFIRKQNRMTISEEGRLFLEKLQPIMEQLDMLEVQMHDLGSKKQNCVRAGVPSFTGTVFLPLIYGGFRRAYPSIELSIYEYSSIHSIEKLIEGEIDVAIVPSTDLDDEWIVSKTLYRSPLCFVTGKYSRFCGRASVSLEQIKNEPLVICSPGYSHHEIVDKLFARHNLTPNIITYSNQLNVAFTLVMEGIASTFWSASLAGCYQGIHAIPLEPLVYQTVSVAWNKKCYLNKSAQIFIEYLLSHYREGPRPDETGR